MASLSSSFSTHAFAPNSFTNTDTAAAHQFPTVSFSRPTRTRHISAAYATATAGSTPASLYEVLGVQAGATGKEIKAAYRRLAREVHPDVVADHDGDSSASSDRFIRVHEAYSTLSDPHRRADYDRAQFISQRLMMNGSPFVAAGRTGTGSGSGFPRRTSRSWETDQCW